MKKIKAILTIFLVATVLFLAPKDTKAYNSAPVLKCHYETNKIQHNDEYKVQIKILYVNGKLEAIKRERSIKNDQVLQGVVVQAKDILGDEAYKKLENIDSSCPKSFESKGSTYKLKGTENLGNVQDKDCQYKEKNKTPSTINVHFYRTKYWKSYAKADGKKSTMTGFWWKKTTFLYNGKNQNLKEHKGAYDSLYNYIVTYSSKTSNCPAKIFYNTKDHRWYAAQSEIIDKQTEGSKNYLEGTDEDYKAYHLNKGKKCEEDLKDLKTKLSVAKTTVGTLENAVKSNDTWDEQAVNTHITQFGNLTKQMQTVNDYMSGCEDESSYKNLKDDMEIISNKYQKLE